MPADKATPKPRVTAPPKTAAKTAKALTASPVARARKTAATGAPTRPAKSRRSPEELNARILDAAIVEFSEHGFSGGRIDRISKRAKTVDRMLYYYFGNKERLYQAVLEHVYAAMIGAQRNFVTPPDDPVAGMRQLIAHSWEHYSTHPELVRLLMTENLMRGKHIRKSPTIKDVSFPLVETVNGILEAGQAKRLFRKDVEPEFVLMSIMSLAFFYVSNHYTCSQWLGVDLADDARRAAWLEHITDVVLTHLQPDVKAVPLATAVKAPAPAKRPTSRG
jgi:AcrR family transcriptional regulator